MTSWDALDVTGREPKSEVVWEIDVGRWKELVVALARCILV